MLLHFYSLYERVVTFRVVVVTSTAQPLGYHSYVDSTDVITIVLGCMKTNVANVSEIYTVLCVKDKRLNMLDGFCLEK